MDEANFPESAKAVLSRLTETQPSGEEWGALGRFLKDNPEGRKAYVNYMAVHAMLHWRSHLAQAPPGKFDVADGASALAAEGANGRPAANANSSVSPRAKRAAAAEISPHKRGRAVFYVLLTVGLTIAFWNVFAFLVKTAQHYAERPNTPIAGSAGRNANAVATLSRAHGLRWKDKSKQWRLGDALVAGDRLALEAGQLELRFADGARAIVRGPADFHVIAKTHARLASGEVVINLPERPTDGRNATPELREKPGHEGHPGESGLASRFVLDTPFASVVDVGTEFGARVSDDGVLNLYVFKGLIELIPLPNGAAADAASQGSARRLVAGESARVSNNGQDVAALSTDEALVLLEDFSLNFLRQMQRIEILGRREVLRRDDVQATADQQIQGEATGCVLIYEGNPRSPSFRRPGNVATWNMRHYDLDDAEKSTEFTPLIFQRVGESQYRLTGVGTTRQINSQIERFNFDVIAGSDAVDAGYTLGFYTGSARWDADEGHVVFTPGAATETAPIFQFVDNDAPSFAGDGWRYYHYVNATRKIGAVEESLPLWQSQRRKYTLTFTAVARDEAAP